MSVKTATKPFENPYRPGAGHSPPYLAGRVKETEEFESLLEQTTILENLVLTGLRGVGKTVLAESFKPLAVKRGWLWVGTELSESASITEGALAVRLLTDLSVVTSNLVLAKKDAAGFAINGAKDVKLDYATLESIFRNTPGLVSDKLKAVLEIVASVVAKEDTAQGLIFGYDEAQTLSDVPEDNEYPLSLLLDVFSSIQRKGIPFMLVLTGLPTLFPKLVEARTFAERMFHVSMLDRLDEEDSKQAIIRPIERAGDCPIKFDPESVSTICQESAGYPYFIQFICKEAFDVFIQQSKQTGEFQSVPMDSITRKLDSDFFAGRWGRATDRQRDLLYVISNLENASEEFTGQEIVAKSAELQDVKVFSSSSQVNQLLGVLSDAGLVYKNRWGKYSLAVPLFDRFIRRQADATAL
jgi:hypothetical protein